MEAKTYIPRRLDDQWKIGWWDLDVALPCLFCFFLGFMANQGMKGMIGGAIVGLKDGLRSFDRLATAFAVFDAGQRLAYFNHAYIKLWQLDPAWLSLPARPAARYRPKLAPADSGMSSAGGGSRRTLVMPAASASASTAAIPPPASAAPAIDINTARGAASATK